MKKKAIITTSILTTAAIIIITTMIITNPICDEYHQQQLGYCVGANTFSPEWETFQCYQYDMIADNNGIINLIDISTYAKTCKEELTTLTKTVNETNSKTKNS